MKKVIVHLSLILLVASIITSCDYVNNAIEPTAPINGGNGGVGIDITDSIKSSNPLQRKVMVEDYTGHKCGNCPAAAIVLKGLETSFGDKIVPIAVHAGFFATTNVTYPTTFTNTTGNAYDALFGNSAAGNPNGLINRVGYGTGGFIKAYTVWGSEVSSALSIPAKFQIKLKYKYNTGSFLMNTIVTVKSLVANTGKYKLVVLLTQDSIIAEQLDYSLPAGSQFIPNYEFNHVLRGAINSTWGEDIFLTGAALNDTETKTKIGYQIDASYKVTKCHIVAYIYDADPVSPTYYEVLQVEEIKLK